jgi:hypothetical protein
MPLLVSALIGGLIQALGTIVGRILISLGIGFVTYQGIDTTLDYVKDTITSNLQGLPADIVGIASICQIDTAVSIIFSAIAVRFVIQGLTSGTMKRMVFK